MPTQSDLAFAVLQSLDIAVLQRVGEKQYQLYGHVPPFYQRLFPQTAGTHCVTPWNHSAMLEFFLDDAELFFEQNEPGTLSSGAWQEEGVEDGWQALLATAVCFDDGKQVLIIRMLRDDYSDRTRILQKAREHLLERRMLSNDLEIYKQKARFDALTTLYNRGAFMEKLQEEVSNVAISGGIFSLLLLDVDSFKTINDTYGHPAGDAVLSEMGKILRSSLRRDDMAARYGGEEFVVLASKTTLEHAVTMAEKLCTRVAEYAFEGLPPVTVSIGCVSYQHGENVEDFIQRVDTALYEAKRTGKNRVCTR